MASLPDMASSPYPAGSVRALLATDLVTEATRTALQARLDAPDYKPQFFDADTYELLRCIAARLLPQPDREAPIELASIIDQRLLAGHSDGWRYDVLPPTVKPTAWVWAVSGKVPGLCSGPRLSS
ncbi:hypothetical protein [Hymenobacter cellulosilyticus]|uniref:Gluconate 2-dehydrogenase subunit 3 family protein n=1 Tax=Hymenobacter cellulosilyticus TaxID=2932248 RepID=A0A8T9QAB2_9BACT|nr:hypothetical protein [Hymenobacter cellulosilyticus]UOQ73078.1 hypothetical protein MUN79_03630 [Hymenobacter cellulosilyticus]